MGIDKSRIIGKSIKDLPKDINTKVQTGDRHREWTKTTTGVIDFLSRCILRYANSYGTTYQISQTKELTIISNKGQSYTLESYTKFLNLIIVDYQDPSEDKPMKLKKQSSYQVGDKVKVRSDLRQSNTGKLTNTDALIHFQGHIITISRVDSDGDYLVLENDRWWSADMFEGLVVEDTHQPTPADIKVGTHWERLKDYYDFPAGEIVTLTKVTETNVIYSDSRGKSIEDFLKTFKPRPDLDTPYAQALQQVDKAFTVLAKTKPVAQSEPNLPFSVGDTFIHPDYGKVTITNILFKCSYPVTYTGPNCPGGYCVDKIDVVEEFIKQSKPVASKKEANPKPIKSEKTFMSKIKASASATVDQNKQAATIALKMEAGRIINKQALKHLKPHVPFFLQGYLSTPLAPVILANAVALLSNHIDHKKGKQLSELMLLAAADSGITSFSLNQLIDDILSNIKLPAGILDDNDDN